MSSLTYLPATGCAPTPISLTPQNKRSVTPDTDTQSQRTKAPTTGPAVIATILAATLDGRQILHKPFVQGWERVSSCGSEPKEGVLPYEQHM